MSASLDEIRSFTTGYFRKKLAVVDLNTPIRDLKIDSLDLVEFLMAVEEKFEVEINADEIDEGMALEKFCQLVGRGL